MNAMTTMLMATALAASQAPMPAPATQPPTVQPAPGALPPPAFANAPPGVVATPEVGMPGWLYPAPFDPARQHWYASFDYVLWDIPNAPLPPLVRNVPVGVLQVVSSDTTVDPNGNVVSVVEMTTPIPVFASLTPGLAGGDNVDVGAHAGGRWSLGFRPDPEGALGFELSFFLLETRSMTYDSRDASAPFAAPTGLSNDVIFLTQFAEATVLSTPIFLAGNSDSRARGSVSNRFRGVQGLVRSKLLYWDFSGIDVFTGFRGLGFHEDLENIEQIRLTFVPPPNVPNFANTTFDRVETSNRFWGAVLGLTYHLDYGPVFLMAQAQLDLGGVKQEVEITSVSVGPDGRILGGGLLAALDQNGRLSRRRLAFIPEVGIKAGVNLSSCARLYVGYDVLALESIVRPGSLFALTSTTTTILVNGSPTTVTVQQPSVRFQDSNILIQGLSFGFEMRF
jgi:hypothetical protein